MGSAPPSPNYGKRLLPVEIDKIAREEPERVLFYLPRKNEPSQGYEIVTTSRFANAINRVCWWLQSEIGSEPKTIGYVGQNDIRYLLLVVAATKTGNKILLSSPRNSVEGHLSLIKQSSCEFWITTSGVGNLDFIKLPSARVPEVDDLLDHTTVRPYSYEKQWHEGRDDVLVLLHTSGSTGLPRLIQLTLASVATGDALGGVDRIEGKLPALVEWSGTKMLNAMPLFHVAGLSFSLCCTVFFGYRVVFPPPGPVMQNAIEDTLDNIDLDSAFVSPLVLIDIAKTPRILSKLAKLKFITSAGGPVPQPVGHIIHSCVPLLQTMGMTEGLLVPSVNTHPNEWAYYHFHPCCGFEMQPYSETLFEMVFVKRKTLAATQAIFLTFPELQTYETKDLYSRHPTVPDLYKYETRKDDLVVLANGEKFNPVGFEFQLAHHPWLSAVYITGRGRFQTAALLSPAQDQLETSDAEILEAIWPALETMNKALPAFAKLDRGFIHVARKPFPLTPKGTVARFEIERLFVKEIDDIYKSDSNGAGASFTSPIDSLQIDVSSKETIRVCVRRALTIVVPGLELEQIGVEDNLLEHGLDSLHVIRLARVLSSAGPSIPIRLDASRIYTNPSIAKLADVLWMQLQDARPGDHISNSEELLRAKDISQTLARHLPSLTLSRKHKEYVVLSGTTGAIGSYLLNALCKNDRVARVWCLNRSSTVDAACRQAQLAKSKGLSSDWKGKVRFVQMDLASEALGLNQNDYREILDQATIIIHNAWEVNFNIPLSSFEIQLIGLQSLVRICIESRHRIHFHFISSISAATNWRSDLLGPVPETKMTNLDASASGYGGSKLVAEHLLSKAAQSGVLHLSVLRVGQVGGPVTTHGDGSMWTRRDWVPAVIDASAFLKKVPADLGAATALDWIPIDLLAEIICQLTDSEASSDSGNEKGGETYYNLVNPQSISWSSLLPTVRSRLETALSLEEEEVQAIPFSQWVDELEKAEEEIIRDGDSKLEASQSQLLASRARTALKLVSFFRTLIKTLPSTDQTPTSGLSWAVSNGLARSSVFAQLPPVSSTWFKIWMDQWGY